MSSLNYHGMRTSYSAEDVTVLLKDLTGRIEPQDTATRERMIQSGTHYCEMLPIEYKPSERYISLYEQALSDNAERMARAVRIVSELLYADTDGKPVLVSLARAGTPVGILIKRYLLARYGCDAPHYTISIIRGRGIDRNALNYILSRHEAARLRFVDGWTGKGAILRQLEEALTDFPALDRRIAVLADPAGITALCGTHEDFLIPSSCLNSTVSGLMSRTVLRADLIGADDFHGAVYYEEMAAEDRSYEFIDAITARFDLTDSPIAAPLPLPRKGTDEVAEIAARYGIKDINLIKPGTGEATRVLLRRFPDRLLVTPDREKQAGIQHLFRLAQEKGVAIEEYPLVNYSACGLIKAMGDV